MQEIIEGLMKLPSYPLNVAETASIQKLLTNLEEITSFSLNKFLISPTKTNLKAYVLTYLKKYLKSWQMSRDQLINWNKKVEKAWSQLKKKPIANDDLFPLTISFLPNDLALLKDIQDKIKLATLIEQDDFIGFIITNLNAALEIKIAHFNTTPIPPVYFSEDFLQTVAEEITRLNQLDVITHTCHQYKNYLAKLIKQEMAKDKLAFDFYFKNNHLSTCTIVNWVLDDLKMSMNFMDDFYILQNNSDLFLLIDKYHAITQMQEVLIGTGQSTKDQLTSFSRKYLEYENLLREEGTYHPPYFFENITHFFTHNLLYDRLVLQKREEQFIENLRMVVHQQNFFPTVSKPLSVKTMS